MTIIFSRQCEYAMQAVIFLALKSSKKMISIKELTDELNIPFHFTAKILQRLTRKGLLSSSKGPHGGFSLAKPPEEITLYQIVEAIDGVDVTHRCVLGFMECTPEEPCAMHQHWTSVRETIMTMLNTKNIGEVAQDMKKPAYRFPKSMQHLEFLKQVQPREMREAVV